MMFGRVCMYRSASNKTEKKKKKKSHKKKIEKEIPWLFVNRYNDIQQNTNVNIIDVFETYDFCPGCQHNNITLKLASEKSKMREYCFS